MPPSSHPLNHFITMQKPRLPFVTIWKVPPSGRCSHRLKVRVLALIGVLPSLDMQRSSIISLDATKQNQQKIILLKIKSTFIYWCGFVDCHKEQKDRKHDKYFIFVLNIQTRRQYWPCIRWMIWAAKKLRRASLNGCTVKKRLASFPSSAGMSLPNSPWAGIMTS